MNSSGLPGWFTGKKNLPANAGDSGYTSSVPESGRSLGEGNGNPHQYSCLENPMARGAWWAIVHGVAKSQRPEQLSMHTCKMNSSVIIQLPSSQTITFMANCLRDTLDCKEIQPVHPKGDQSIGRTDAEAETPILWPPHVKN